TSSGYRELIERELAKRLGRTGATEVAPYSGSQASESVAQGFSPASASATSACPSCATVNDDDAKFCKSCGTKLLSMLLAIFIPFSLFLFPFVPSASAQFQMPDPKQMS